MKLNILYYSIYNIKMIKPEKQEQAYILLIMNCEKYKEKAIQQKNGWLKNIPEYIQYYHVMGNPLLQTQFKYDNDERILWVKTLDDYVSLPKKVISAMYAIKETFKFKYVFKTDDDQDLQDITFFDMITNSIKEKEKKMKAHYGGQLIDVQIPYLSKYFMIHPELPQDMIIHKTEYCSSRFYFLSSESVSNLLTKREKIENEYLEDYAIGLYLNPILKKIILNIQSDKYFTDRYIDSDNSDSDIFSI